MAASSIAALAADCRPSQRHERFSVIKKQAGKLNGAKAGYRLTLKLPGVRVEPMVRQVRVGRMLHLLCELSYVGIISLSLLPILFLLVHVT